MNNFNNERIKYLLKKNLLIIYLIFFIILNILDFFGISGDLDVFKKLLSWYIIGYLFYKVSPSKIFIGRKDKFYDITLISILTIFIIFKDLYTYFSALHFYDLNSYHIFYYFVYLFDIIMNKGHFYAQNIIFYMELIILFFILILTFYLLRKYKVEENSLIGSFHLKEYLKFIHIDFFLLLFFEYVFILVIFELFMEWFAVAIDAIILVVGLIYYIVIYIMNHTSLNLNFLKKVSESGEEFIENLLHTFSSKKTFLIGLSFILSIHLLVDAGVFLFPYSLGVGSYFYFGTLNLDGHSHDYIFNIKHFSKSIFYNDLEKINSLSKNFIVKLFVSISDFFIYIISIFLFFIFLLMPIYIFYKNINYNEIKLSKIFLVIFFSSLFIFILLNIYYNISSILSTKHFSINLIPFSISYIPYHVKTYGVDIFTNSLLKINFFILIFSTFFLFPIIFYYLKKNIQKHFIFWKKSFYTLILLFFIFYICLFAYSLFSLKYQTFKSQGSGNNFKIINDNQFNNINKFKTFYENSSNLKKIGSYYILENLKLKLNLSNNFNNLSVNKINLVKKNLSSFNVKKIYFIYNFNLKKKYFKNKIIISLNKKLNFSKLKNYSIYYLNSNNYLEKNTTLLLILPNKNYLNFTFRKKISYRKLNINNEIINKIINSLFIVNKTESKKLINKNTFNYIILNCKNKKEITINYKYKNNLWTIYSCYILINGKYKDFFIINKFNNNYIYDSKDYNLVYDGINNQTFILEDNKDNIYKNFYNLTILLSNNSIKKFSNLEKLFLFSKYKTKTFIKIELTNLISIIEIIILFLFYFLSLIIYTIYFIKNNLLDERNDAKSTNPDLS